jgi:hypothetical protein
MLGWISSLLGFVTGAFQQLWDDLINIIKSVDGYLEGRVNNLQNQMNAVIAGEWNLSRYIANFVNGPYTNFVRWTENRTDSIVNYVNVKYNALAGDINQTRSWTSGLVSGAEALARTLFGNLTKWIISTIFGPLSRDIATALGWILKEGAFLLDIITHPDKLIALILHYIFGLWVTLLIKYGPLAFAYGLRHWKSMLPTFLTVIEDIIFHVL